MLVGELTDEVDDGALGRADGEDGVDAECREGFPERDAPVPRVLVVRQAQPVGLFGRAVERQVEAEVAGDGKVNSPIEEGDKERGFGGLARVLSESVGKRCCLPLNPPAGWGEDEPHGVARGDRCRRCEPKQLGKVGHGQRGFDALVLEGLLDESVAGPLGKSETLSVADLDRAPRAEVCRESGCLGWGGQVGHPYRCHGSFGCRCLPESIRDQVACELHAEVTGLLGLWLGLDERELREDGWQLGAVGLCRRGHGNPRARRRIGRARGAARPLALPWRGRPPPGTMVPRPDGTARPTRRPKRWLSCRVLLDRAMWHPWSGCEVDTELSAWDSGEAFFEVETLGEELWPDSEEHRRYEAVLEHWTDQAP